MNIIIDKQLTLTYKNEEEGRTYTLIVQDGCPLKEAMQACAYFSAAFKKIEEDATDSKKENEEMINVDSDEN